MMSAFMFFLLLSVLFVYLKMSINPDGNVENQSNGSDALIDETNELKPAVMVPSFDEAAVRVISPSNFQGRSSARSALNDTAMINAHTNRLEVINCPFLLR